MSVHYIIKIHGITYISLDTLLDEQDAFTPEKTNLRWFDNELVLAKRNHSQTDYFLKTTLKELTPSEVSNMDKRYVVNQIANPLFIHAKEKDYINKDNRELDNTYIIVTPGSSFVIDDNFCVTEINHYAALIPDQAVIYPSLSTMSNQSLIPDIQHAFRIMKNKLIYIKRDLLVFDNKTFEFRAFLGGHDGYADQRK